MAPPTLPPRPPRKKIKQEIKTEPIEQVWMDQHVSNMGEEFSRPVQTIKQEPIAMEIYAAEDFDNPSNADNENDHKETGGNEDTNEGNSGFLILPNGKVRCPNCQKIAGLENAWYRDLHINTDHGTSARALDLETIKSEEISEDEF